MSACRMGKDVLFLLLAIALLCVPALLMWGAAFVLGPVLPLLLSGVCLMSFPCLAMSVWLGWQDGKAATSHARSRVRIALFALVPCVLAGVVLGYQVGNLGSPYLSTGVMVLLVPGYLVSRLVGPRISRGRLDSWFGLVGMECVLCLRKINLMVPARGLASGQAVHTECEQMEAGELLRVGPAWLLLVSWALYVVGYDWVPEMVPPWVTEFCRPTVVVVFLWSWWDTRVGAGWQKKGEFHVLAAVLVVVLGEFELEWSAVLPPLMDAMMAEEVDNLLVLSLAWEGFQYHLMAYVCGWLSAWFWGAVVIRLLRASGLLQKG